MPRGVLTKVPLSLLAVVKSHLGTLAWLQLCNPQGVALFSFVRLPPRMPSPFAGVPVYGTLMNAERLRVLGCGFMGKLVRMLSQGVGGHFEPRSNASACSKMMWCTVRRVAAGLAAAVRDNIFKEAEDLCTSGQCAAALVPLQRAIDLGHLPSLALKAWLLVQGREGVPEDRKAAFDLVSQGVGLGCHHCQGVMAYCFSFFTGFGPLLHPLSWDEARCHILAIESSRKGSRYGQHTLGEMLYLYCAGVSWKSNGQVDRKLRADAEAVKMTAQAVAYYQLAAAQGLDAAQCSLGNMYRHGYGVAQDRNEALRLYQLAATQGLPQAFLAATNMSGLV